MQNNKKSTPQFTDYTTLVWAIAFGVICFATHIFICNFTEADPSLTGLILLAVYVAAVSILSVSVYRYHKMRDGAEKSLSTNTNAIRDLVAQVGTPMLLSDGNGKLVWYNSSAAETFSLGDSAIGTSMYGICDTTEEKLLTATAEGGTVNVIGDRSYLITCFKVHTSVKSRDDVRELYLTVFNDNTELTETRDKMERTLPVLAYIVVDNLEELTQYVRVSYRQATGEIEAVLKGWAESLDGVLREYGRDRYILIFTREKLNECIKDKFSILDRIRCIHLTDDDNNAPVTVSMGISAAPVSSEIFNLVDIERNALSALDLALQRGGDQVTLKTENGIEYFGGRTKNIQTRTRVRARVIAGQLCSLITASSRVIVMGHRNPDFDSIGACVGIARLAMHCGVECRIVADQSNENFIVSTERLRGLADYEHIFIDGARALDLMTPSTLLIVVDANNFSILEAPEVAENAKTIYVIDHHRQVGEMPEAVVSPPYIDPAASSSCELVAEIIEQCVPTGTLQKEEANVMLSGIMVDTKNFTRTTGTRTFGAALFLRGEGGNSEIARTFFEENFGDYLAEAKFGGDVVTYKNRIAITKSEGTSSSADRVAAAKAADKLLTVRGIDASFALVDVGGSVNVSARSNGKINVQLILEKLGGGGHFDAAGAQFSGTTLYEAAERLKSAIDEYLDNNKE